MTKLVTALNKPDVLSFGSGAYYVDGFSDEPLCMSYKLATSLGNSLGYKVKRHPYFPLTKFQKLLKVLGVPERYWA